MNDKLQFSKAIGLWENFAEQDDSIPTVLRNLSIAYYNKSGEPQKAHTCLERAFDLDRSDARVFLELDQLYQKLSYTPAQRLAKFKDSLSDRKA